MRLVVWSLLVALGAGCASPEAPEASPAETPQVAVLGTDADRLAATVVHLAPADHDGATPTARVDARVADDDAARAEGLMGVDPLPDGAGMLFVYPEERTGAFWMKDTLVPLDIAFIAADGTVREVLTMEPCTADPCPIYDPEVDYLAALEVPAGWFATWDIDVGATARWSDPVAAEPVAADPVPDGPAGQ
jgi:uncharacterized protein